MKNNKGKKGKLIWITGLSGSGKSLVARKLKKKLDVKMNPFLHFDGDDIRKIFNFNKSDYNHRLKYAFSYSKLCKKLTDQNFNVILAAISMFDDVRKWNRKNIKNYFEIYIKCKKKDLQKKNKKNLYKGKKKNVVGKDIVPQLPKNPDAIIVNNFKNDLNLPINKVLNRIVKKFEK